MTDPKDYLARQNANRMADAAVAKAAGVTASKVVARPVCLVTSLTERTDLPPGVLLCKMSPAVVEALASVGLREPVSMTLLPGKWWVANVDAAAVNPNVESGGCTVRVETDSEDLCCRYSRYYCEVIDGPFSNPDEISGTRS